MTDSNQSDDSAKKTSNAIEDLKRLIEESKQKRLKAEQEQNEDVDFKAKAEDLKTSSDKALSDLKLKFADTFKRLKKEDEK